jgi:hypothetical protein
MRTKISLMMGVVLVIGTMTAQAEIVSINEVQVFPDTPSLNDIITFEVSGGFTHMGPSFDESEFNQNVFSLELNLFFTDGFGPMIPDVWSHSKEIGMLLAGVYDLNVEAYMRLSTESEYILHDTYPVQFEVIPEPATAFLFGLGVVFILRKKHGIIFRQNYSPNK